jgi:hypothetical protein
MVWEVTVTDGEETFILSWNYSSRYTNHFFRALPNIDIAQEVKINPWSMRDKNDPSKTAIGLSMYQGGNKVEFYYTKDEPRDMPDLVQTKVKGKVQWDDSDQLEFFEVMAKKIFSGAAVSAQEDEDAPF